MNSKIVSSALIAIFLLTLFVPLVHGAEASPDSNGTRTPIKHVVEIMMENHSFDNLFGVYPSNTLGTANTDVANITRPVNLISINNSPGLQANPEGTFTTPDPIEGYAAYHLDWNNGLMNGFRANSGPQSMTYYSASQSAPEWVIAEEYSLDQCDFAMLTETCPNRLYNLAGYSPVINDYGPPPYIPYAQSIMSELDSRSISWGYYVHDASNGYYPLSYFQGIQQHLQNVHSWTDFFSSLGNNSLPSVSWVMPIGSGGTGYYSQGPNANVMVGQMWFLYIINAIMKSPYWNSTAIFLTYDEGGGYYDQVPPPYFHGVQLGQRVPFMVISPYAKEDYISSSVLDQGSIPAFVDYNWKLPALNDFVWHSNIPLDMFDFNAPYKAGNILRSPINLAGMGLPLPDQIAFTPNSSLDRNYSSLFPAVLQIPYSQLPYAPVGSENLSLSNISSELYVTSNYPYVPFYYSGAMLYAMLILSVMVLILVPDFARKKSGKIR